MRSLTLVGSVLLLVVSSTTAWPWSGHHYSLNRRDANLIVARQNSQGSQSAQPSKTPDSPATASITGSASAAQTDASAVTSASDARISQSGSNSASGSNNPTGTRTKSSKSSAIDPRIPAGGVLLMTPAPTTTQYYKIGDFVTFAWNYTSLIVTPSAVNVLASCKDNDATYTIALNQTIEPTNKVLWDTGEYQATATIPLLTAKYTLIIHDSNGTISDMPQSGYLAVFNQFVFGMYSPEPYTPLGSYQCATCSGALSSFELQTFGFMLSMMTITIISFTWFANGFGVI